RAQARGSRPARTRSDTRRGRCHRLPTCGLNPRRQPPARRARALLPEKSLSAWSSFQRSPFLDRTFVETRLPTVHIARAVDGCGAAPGVELGLWRSAEPAVAGADGVPVGTAIRAGGGAAAQDRGTGGCGDQLFACHG